MPFSIIREDITRLRVDAIVNAANPCLQRGGGVCGAIFAAAGVKKLQKACDKIGGCETGQAVLTKGFALPAKYIIHTVEPHWQGGEESESEKLYACYQNALELAKENRLESVAFPLISSGAYGCPKDQALQIAVTAIGDFLLKNDMTVSLVVFDKAAYVLSAQLYTSIQSFIDDRYVEIHFPPRSVQGESMPPDASFAALKAEEEDFYETKALSEAPKPVAAQMPRMAPMPPQAHDLEDVFSHMEESFSQRLLRLIDEQGHSDSEVYKRANIDRRLFSKIRSNPNYRPSKATALAFAIALELSLTDTRELLLSAGFALSRSSKQDVIVEYFIAEKNYNIFAINEVLFAFEQGLLGA